MFRHKITFLGVYRGMVAGAIGGAVGAWAMNQLQPQAKPAQKRIRGGGNARASGQVQTRKAVAEGKEDATVKVAEIASRKLFDHALTEQEKQIAGPAVHYGYGMAVGALYGGLAEMWPNVKVGLGMGYGMALWALGSEAALPVLRLSPPLVDVPVEKHADALASHVCFGITLDVVRRLSKLFV